MILENIKGINFLPPPELFSRTLFSPLMWSGMWEGEGRALPLLFNYMENWRSFLRVTRDTAKEKSGYILEKILPSFLLSQGTQHIIHVKDVRRLMENQRVPMLTKWQWCPSNCLPPFLALADWWTPGPVWLPNGGQQRADRETIETLCTAGHVAPPSHGCLLPLSVNIDHSRPWSAGCHQPWMRNL